MKYTKELEAEAKNISPESLTILKEYAWPGNVRELENVIKKAILFAKGNVILQFCDLTVEDIPCIAEVNEDKFGCFAPGTKIPILSQKEADAKKPDYYLVMPWHFKNGIVKGLSEYLKNGGSLIFPLPEMTIVDAKSEQRRETAKVL